MRGPRVQQEDKGTRKALIGLLLLLSLSGLSLVHISGGIEGLLFAVRRARLGIVALAALILFLAEIVKAWRLVIIAERLGLRVGFWHSLLARIAGRFVGVLTPAYAGATPVRALVLSAYTRLEPGTSFGLAVAESLLDTLIPVVVAIGFSLPLLPRTWLVLLVSLCLASAWILGLLYAGSKRFERRLRRLRLPDRAVCYIMRQRSLFLEGIRGASDRRVLAPALAITLAAHLVEATALMVILAYRGLMRPGLGLLAYSFLLLEASYVLSMSITPGGAAFFEYGLAGLMDPTSLFEWRLAYLSFSLIPGFLAVLAVRPVREYIRHALESDNEGADCDEAGEDI